MKTSAHRLGVSLPGGLLMVAFALACQLSPIANSTNLQGTVAALATENADQAAQLGAQATIISHLATRLPANRTPGPRPRPTPYLPVRGSVSIEDGSCCVGGLAGEQIEVMVAFEAYSPIAEVTHMRTRAGGLPFNEEQMEGAEWEPYEPQKYFPVDVAINWIGFFVSVQYRDKKGNLSAVYHDDISVEGHPPSPTPFP